jgi:putative FmdB family regulatory protein
MPTYEYACTSCGNEWEAEQSIKEAPLTECPSCHEGTARRQISRGVGFILKGGGWYSDLYSSASNKKPDASDKAADKSSGDKAADKSGGDKGSSGSSTPDTSSSSSSSSSSSPSKPSTSTASTAAA